MLLFLLPHWRLTAWLAIKKRSRNGLVWMSVFSLAYFGFYRQGCICSVGSVQNVSLALFNTGYSIPLTALLFFIIPLLFALAYGRVFCAGVCPLGAIQELTGIRPVKLNKNVEVILASVPFIYLATAVLFAATNSQFLICRYDPFIGIFRLDAPYTMIVFGASPASRRDILKQALLQVSLSVWRACLISFQDLPENTLQLLRLNAQTADCVRRLVRIMQ